MPDGDRSSRTARSLSERISHAISSGADADGIADQQVSAATNAAVSAIGQGLDHDAQTLQDPHASAVDKGLAGLDLAATAPAVVPGLQGEFAAKVLATNTLRLGLKALKVDALIRTASTVVGGAGAHIAEAVQRTGVRKFAEHVFGHDIGAQAHQAAQHGMAHAGSGLPKAAHPAAPSVVHPVTLGRIQHVERTKPLTAHRQPFSAACEAPISRANVRDRILSRIGIPSPGEGLLLCRLSPRRSSEARG